MVNPQQYQQKRKWVAAAEFVGLAHYLIATMIMILGESTNLFADMKSQHSGLVAVYRFLDMPIARILHGMVEASFTEFWFAIVVGQLVIILSSLLYAFITYILFSIVLFVFVE